MFINILSQIKSIHHPGCAATHTIILSISIISTASLLTTAYKDIPTKQMFFCIGIGVISHGALK